MKLFSTGEGSSPRVRGKRRIGRIPARPVRLIPARAGKTPRTAGRGARGRAHPRACGENSLARPWNARENGSSPRVRGKPPGRQRRPGGEGLIPARAGKTPSGRRSPRDVPAHPRACGENAAVIWMVAGPLGSSPRVRGKPRVRVPVRSGRRLIPARAGKTVARSSSGRVSQAHPRACGENRLTALTRIGTAGSSPRVRGKPAMLVCLASSTGLIPARAGKTSQPPAAPSQCPAHPRACGENRDGVLRSMSIGGSSPRVRGKRASDPAASWARGLIPARAGKTASALVVAERPPAHPRACGENGAVDTAARPALGSSPRVRGKRLCGRPGAHRRGLIPARAGKTGPRTAGRPSCGAHPRACGENSRLSEEEINQMGSSPRVRGKLVHRFDSADDGGLIPARAGKTWHCRCPFRVGWAHPRACGENPARTRATWCAIGSSPRVRGKLRGRVGTHLHAGLIPARAGKTRYSARSP